MKEWCDNGELRRVEKWNEFECEEKCNVVQYFEFFEVLNFDFLLILKGIAVENGIKCGKKWIIEL